MRRSCLGLVVSAAAVAACACGSPQPREATPPPAAAAESGSKAVESRWLRGLWATDIRSALATIGLSCKGPMQENRTNVWMCESGTPLVSYQVRFYGSAPGKIEYINAVVSQSGPAKDAVPLRLFGVLANFRFDGADQARTREWLLASLAGGGSMTVGPAKYKLAGDAGRRTLDIKASGSEW